MTAVPVREAATVILVRDGEHGPEVFLLRRHPGAAFVPGAHVFPGGAVDPGDRLPGDRLPGLDRFAVAAVREAFEEAGVLLADGPDGTPVDLDDAALAARIGRGREEMLAGRLGFAELCAAEGLAPAVHRLVPLSRWVTPMGGTRRFDTVFFLAHAPDGHAYLHDDRETVASRWIRPVDALEANGTGEIELVYPTRRTMEQLVGAAGAEALLATAVDGDLLPIHTRRLVVDGEVQMVIPGDVGYDEAEPLS